MEERSYAKMVDMQDKKPNKTVSHDSQTVQANNTTEATLQDSGSIAMSSNDNRKVSSDDIELVGCYIDVVQNLIERCLQLYMNKDEVVKTLLNRARIDPAFTALVWQKLEEENADFFRAYYIRLKLKKQIILFNHLIEHQYRVMKSPVGPMQNGVYPMPVSNSTMGYPAAQQPRNDAKDYPNIVDGFPAPANILPAGTNSRNEQTNETTGGADLLRVMPPNSEISDMPVIPTLVTSGGHFTFGASDLSCIGVDTSTLDAAFTSEVELMIDNGAGDSRDPLGQMLWNFSLSDLTVDISNLGDLEALGNYPVEEFFADSDSVPRKCLPSDEEKS